MRRTFGYLAQQIINAYREESATKCDFWAMAERAKADGNEVSEKLYTKIGNDHSIKASALLDIIIAENLATPQEIIDIDQENAHLAKKYKA